MTAQIHPPEEKEKIINKRLVRHNMYFIIIFFSKNQKA
jgi:hypothetical protein